jgi:hypothetical protein
MARTESIPIEGARTATPLEGLGGAPLRQGGERASLRAEDGVRPDIRSESVREAEEYARALIETRGDSTYDVDEFYIDPSIVPDGWGYEWKASHIAGKENGYHILTLRRAGWRHVPASRHPEMMPDGWEGSVEKKGLFLMELPKILIDRTQKQQMREAREVLRNSEAQLYETPRNTATRDDVGLKMHGLNKVTRDIVNPKQGRMDD